MVGEVEVIVGDIAAAGQHGFAVDDQELAVRAVLDADQPVEGAGVVVAHLHPRLAEQPGVGGLELEHGSREVDQDAHVHALAGFLDQRLRDEAGGIIHVVDEELERDRFPRGCDELQAAVERGGALVEVREQVRVGGMRLKALLDLGILAHDPFEDRETDREEEVDGEDGPDDSEGDLLQQPHAVIISPRSLRPHDGQRGAGRLARSRCRRASARKSSRYSRWR